MDMVKTNTSGCWGNFSIHTNIFLLCLTNKKKINPNHQTPASDDILELEISSLYTSGMKEVSQNLISRKMLD